MKTILIIYTLLLVYNVQAQNIHTGLKPYPDLKELGVIKYNKAYKYNPTTKKQTEGVATVYNNGILLSFGSTVKVFNLEHGDNIYSDDEGKLFKAYVDSEGVYLIFEVTPQTVYLISLKSN